MYSNLNEDEYETGYTPILEADKTNFVCFSFQDDSIYYGEIQYQDKEGKCLTKEEMENLEPNLDENGQEIK